MPEMPAGKRGAGSWRRKDYTPTPTRAKRIHCYVCNRTWYVRDNSERAALDHQTTEHPRPEART